MVKLMDVKCSPVLKNILKKKAKVVLPIAHVKMKNKKLLIIAKLNNIAILSKNQNLNLIKMMIRTKKIKMKIGIKKT